MQLSEIKSYQDLERFFENARKAGFNLGSEYECHTKHLKTLLANNNPLCLEVPKFLAEPKRDLAYDYVAFEQAAKEYFGALGIHDALLERASKVYYPEKFSSYPKVKTLDEVLALGFKPLSDEFDYNGHNSWYAYDFSVDPTKFRWRLGERYDLNRLLLLLEAGFQIEYRYELETEKYKVFQNGNIIFKNPDLAKKMLDLAIELAYKRKYEHHLYKFPSTNTPAS